MKKFLFFFFIVFSFSGFSQNSELSDLLQKFKKAKDNSDKFELLHQIIGESADEMPDTAVKYGDYWFDTLNYLSNQIETAEVYFYLGKAHNKLGDYQLSRETILKAIEWFSKSDDHDFAAKSYLIQADNFSQLGLHDSTLFYADKFISTYNGQDEILQGDARRMIGSSFWHKGNYKNALINIDDALNHYETVGDSNKLAISYNRKGAILWGMADFEKALEHFFKALSIRESLDKDYERLIILYNNIGLVYHDWGRLEDAITYYKRALGLISGNENTLGEAYTYLNMGTHYFRVNDLPTAMDYFHRSQKGYQAINDLNGVSLCQIRLGQVYMKSEQYQKASNSLESALKTALEADSPHRKCLALYNLSKLNYNIGNYADSKEYAEESLLLAERGGYKNLIYLILEQLSESLVELNKLEEALHVFKRSAIVKDSVFKDKTAVQFTMLELSHENEQAEIRNQELEKQNALNSKTIRYQYLSVGFALLLLIASVFLIRILVKSRKKLLASNEAKDKVFSIISHDLRSPIGNLNNMLEYVEEEGTDVDYGKIFKMFRPAVASTYNMLENLLIWAKSNQGKLVVLASSFDLKELIEETIQFSSEIAQSKSIALKNEFHEKVMIQGDRIMIQTVLRNLISNSIKFTSPGGEVIISAETIKKKAVIHVSDNGIGISEENRQTLFTPDTSINVGTNKEKGSGLGLILCKELIEKNGGEIWLSEQEKPGTCISFSVPQ